jgi:hypothetical protein
MSLNRILLSVISCALVFACAMSLAGLTGTAAPAARATDAKTEQEVLKANADCNAAELRTDMGAIDACETDDFTHTHASGQVEYKGEYMKGIGSGAHKFLTLDQTDLHVRSYNGNSAIVEGYIHLRADNNGRIADVNNRLMTVWVKEKGKWREAAWFAVGLQKAAAQASQNK